MYRGASFSGCWVLIEIQLFYLKKINCGLTFLFRASNKSWLLLAMKGVGKQSLLHIFATNKTIPRSHDMPLTEASYTLDIEVHGKPIILYRLHTAGYEEYDQTRYG